jgi:predicted MPP superfamily phosphohydrolase
VNRIVRGLIFLALVLSIWGGMHYYVWARLLRDTGSSPTVLALGGVLLALAAVTTFLSLLRVLPKSIARPLWTGGFAWAGFVFLLNAALGVSDLVRLVLHLAQVPTDPQRLAQVLGGGALLVALLLAVGAWRRAVGDTPVKRVEVKLDRLPPAFDGFSIVQISDLHVSPDTRVQRVRRLVERINAEQPDLIALTGDLVDGSPELLKDGVAPLGELKARHGSFFVTGNHEYYSGADRWVTLFQGLGMRTLLNEIVEIRRGDHAFDLVGVPDLQGVAFGPRHTPQLSRVLSGRDESREVVLLAHQPRQFPEAARHGVGLQISGHTHGGQIWPFTWLIHLGERYVAGIHREGRSQLYVSRGTGYWGPPMRLGAPKEITHITLRAG